MSTSTGDLAATINALASGLVRRLENDGLVTIDDGRVAWMHDKSVTTTLSFTVEGVQQLVDLARLTADADA